MKRRSLVLALTCTPVAAAVAIFLAGRHPTREREDDPEARVRAACSACHPLPPPEILPRALWAAQIERMRHLVDYLPEAGAEAFCVEEAVEWYESRAPEELPVEARLTREGPPPLRFRRRNVLLGAGGGPGIATVTGLDGLPVPGLDPSLATPHMSNGSIHLFSLQHGPRKVGEARHPVRISTGDLDGDGLADLVVSDLGSPTPTDELVGRVLVGSNRGDGSFGWRVVAEGLPRVADTRPIDVDGDGDLDLAVAAFGWLRSGGVYLLRNQTRPGSAPSFELEPVSADAGAVSVVPVEDLSPGSGPGFAVAFSQHHERVSLFQPAGEGFEERVLYRAPHPNWGISNLEAADLDADSDTDFLLAHGDTLDDGVALKFYHGVEWLENRGGSFHARRIGGLYGAHRAVAADIDRDGDLDVLASSFLPQVQLPVAPGRLQVDSVVWFERRDGDWIPWSVEANHPRHTGAAVVDIDRDGWLDVVVAINTAWDVESRDEGPSLEVYFNRGPRAEPLPADPLPENPKDR